MATCLLGLGANLGDRQNQLLRAIECLKWHEQIQSCRVSPWHATHPVGGPAGQADFLNAVAIIETTLGPQKLLQELQRIEDELGRVREVRWDSRAIDLDLLLYDGLEFQSSELEIPHPRMSFRRFVLEPAAEIAADMTYPVNGWTIRQLLDNLNRPENHLAVCGNTFDLAALAPTVYVIRAPNNLNRPSEQAMSALDLLPEISRRAALLAPAALPEKAWTISDFWFEEIKLFAAIQESYDRLALEAIESELSRHRQVITRPKLVVIGDLPPSAEQPLAAMLHRCDSPPALRLTAHDPERGAAEVLAAIQAMR